MTTAAVSASGPIPRARGGMLRTIYIVWWRDIIRFWRDRARLVASFAHADGQGPHHTRRFFERRAR